jgi:hypothetical protein
MIAVGIVAERSRRVDPFDAVEVTVPRGVTFEPLARPLGDLRLRGRVRTHRGAPAPEVVVHLLSDDPDAAGDPVHWALTDADGAFELFGLRAGAFRAVLLWPGHPNTVARVRVPLSDETANGEVTLALAPPLEPIPDLPPFERAPIAGELRRPAGLRARELAGYEVVFLPTERNERLSGAAVVRVTTDEEGRFRVDDLVLADYRVQVLPAWASGGSWPVLAEAPCAHDAAGPRGEDDVTLLLWLTCGEVRGSLRDRKLRPIEGALVTLAPESDPTRPWPPRATDASGSFAITDVPAGAYRVRVHAGGAVREELVVVGAGRSEELSFEPLDTRSE